MSKNQDHENIKLTIVIIIITILISIGTTVRILDLCSDDFKLIVNLDKCSDEVGTVSTLTCKCPYIICNDLNMTPSGSQSYIEGEVDCRTKNGGTVTVGICGTKIDSCKKLCRERSKLQKCLYEY